MSLAVPGRPREIGGPLEARKCSSLFERVVGPDPLAFDCMIGIAEGDDEDGDHPLFAATEVLESLDLLHVSGPGLAHLYVGLGCDPEAVRIAVFGVTVGCVPIHKLRDAALGLPVRFDVAQVRRDLEAASGPPGG